MNTVKYKFKTNETFESVAYDYGTSVATLVKINNINGNIPVYIQDSPTLNKAGYLYVPITGNGGNWETPDFFEVPLNGNSMSYIISSYKLGGSGGSVMLTIGDEILDMPCYPTSLSDNVTSNYSSNTIYGMTEPYLNYNTSGPRTVSASFTLHREMLGENYSKIDHIVDVVQSAVYPNVDSGSSEATMASLIVGEELSITGVVNGQIGISYSGPIIDGKHNIIEFSISITEVTGDTISNSIKSKKGSRM